MTTPQQAWDQRYAAAELVWSAGPNTWVEQVVADWPAGLAVDLAAGEGRNALWLAERGWDATAVDFSAVGLARADRLADERLAADARGRFHTAHADLLEWRPDRAYDLVLLAYLQIPAEQRSAVMRAAAGAVAPGGHLLVIAHDSENLDRGHGGPSDPAVLYSAADVVADVADLGLVPLRAEQVTRLVATADGDRQALDALALLRRP